MIASVATVRDDVSTCCYRACCCRSSTAAKVGSIRFFTAENGARKLFRWKWHPANFRNIFTWPKNLAGQFFVTTTRQTERQTDRKDSRWIGSCAAKLSL